MVKPELPYWINADWDQVEALSIDPYLLQDSDYDDDGPALLLARGPFVVEQLEVGDGAEVVWMPALASNLTVLTDPKYDRRIVRFDDDAKDHEIEANGRATWRNGALVVSTPTVGTIVIRAVTPKDAALLGGRFLKRQTLNVTEIAKLYWGDADFSKYIDESKLPQQLVTSAELWERRKQ
jgi:hypothetical protein